MAFPRVFSHVRVFLRAALPALVCTLSGAPGCGQDDVRPPQVDRRPPTVTLAPDEIWDR